MSIEGPSQLPVQTYGGAYAPRRIFEYPMSVYYIDMPGAGQSGSDITGDGSKARVIAEYDRSADPVNWFHRDLYLWFPETFEVKSPYLAPMIWLHWDDLHAKGGVEFGVPGADRYRTIAPELQFLSEPYDSLFSWNNLPSFHGSEFTFGMAYRLWTGSYHTRVENEYNLVDRLVSGAFRILRSWSTGDLIYGFRLRFTDVADPYHDVDYTYAALGEFLTGESDPETWQWPEDVWAWIWDNES